MGEDEAAAVSTHLCRPSLRALNLHLLVTITLPM
jgi:hypothetical protein